MQSYVDYSPPLFLPRLSVLALKGWQMANCFRGSMEQVLLSLRSFCDSLPGINPLEMVHGLTRQPHDLTDGLTASEANAHSRLLNLLTETMRGSALLVGHQ